MCLVVDLYRVEKLIQPLQLHYKKNATTDCKLSTLTLGSQLDRNSYEMRQTLHPRSNSVQNSSKKLKQHLEEEIIEERNNSKSILQKNRKTSNTGLTGGLGERHRCIVRTITQRRCLQKQNAPNHRFKRWSRIQGIGSTCAVLQLVWGLVQWIHR